MVGGWIRVFGFVLWWLFWGLFGFVAWVGGCFVLWLIVAFEFLWLFVFRVGGWFGCLDCVVLFWLCVLVLARLFSMLSLVR